MASYNSIFLHAYIPVFLSTDPSASRYLKRPRWLNSVSFGDFRGDQSPKSNAAPTPPPSYAKQTHFLNSENRRKYFIPKD